MNPHPSLCLLILNRGRKAGRERERNIDVKEKHLLVASHKCPYQELNLQPRVCALTRNWTWNLSVYGSTLQPTESHQLHGRLIHFWLSAVTCVANISLFCNWLILIDLVDWLIMWSNLSIYLYTSWPWRQNQKPILIYKPYTICPYDLTITVIIVMNLGLTFLKGGIDFT